jgi:hypothetical protein
VFFRNARRKTDTKVVGPCKKVDKDEKLQSNSSQTSKNTKKDIKIVQKQYKINGFLGLRNLKFIPVNIPESP